MEFLRAILVSTALLALAVHATASEENVETEQELTNSLIRDVLQRIRGDYVGEVDEMALRHAAIKAMLAQLDSRSQLLPSEKFRELMDNVHSRVEGIGIDLELRDGTFHVIAPIDGSPAARAGVEPGDRLLAVDGQPLNNLSTQDVMAMLRGEPETEVELLMQRNFRAPVKLLLRRESIRRSTVSSQELEQGYVYVRLGFFGSGTAEDLSKALEPWLPREDGPALHGVILDLRNNPGGLVDAAIASADLFLDSGVIVKAEGRKPEYDFEAEATAGDITGRAPMVLMINRGTASSAEILAAALQDNRRAVLQGTNTFGKGSLQEYVPLATGEALRLTVAHYRTPRGRVIEKQGVAPDLLAHELRRSGSGSASPWSQRLLPSLISGQSWVFEERRTMDDEGAQSIKPVDDPLVQQALNTLKGRKLLSGFDLETE